MVRSDARSLRWPVTKRRRLQARGAGAAASGTPIRHWPTAAFAGVHEKSRRGGHAGFLVVSRRGVVLVES